MKLIEVKIIYNTEYHANDSFLSVQDHIQELLYFVRQHPGTIHASQTIIEEGGDSGD